VFVGVVINVLSHLHDFAADLVACTRLTLFMSVAASRPVITLRV